MTISSEEVKRMMPMGGPCDIDRCEHLATECHGGEIYLCITHYREMAAAMDVIEPDAWIEAKNGGTR